MIFKLIKLFFIILLAQYNNHIRFLDSPLHQSHIPCISNTYNNGNIYIHIYGFSEQKGGEKRKKKKRGENKRMARRGRERRMLKGG